jgi:regulator of protease activity HflC (stomatin/prohibitin superfamily)
VFTLLSAIVVINPGWVGVQIQLGQMIGVMQPGIHFVVPVITTIPQLSTQTMKYQVDASAASSDLQIVTTKIAVNYKIKSDDESVKYIYSQFMGMHEDRIIQPLVQEVVKANTAKFTANDLIQKRETVKVAITSMLKEKLAPYGIQVDEVSVTDFAFSPEFEKAIEAKVVVEQEKQKSQLELEQKQITVMQMVVEQNATATAQIIQANADAQTAMLLAAGQANATLTNAEAQRQAIDKIQKVLTPEYVKYIQANRWDGKLPYLMTGDSGMLLNIGVNGSR